MGASRRHGGGLSAAALSVVMAVSTFVVAADASAIEVRVRAQSSLQVEAHAAGTDVRINGTLRDKNGRGLAQRRIRVTLEGEARDGEESYLEQMTYTDRNGRFTHTREVEPGEWDIAVYFEETDHITESRVDRTLQVEPEPVDVELRAPEIVFAPDDPAPVDVRATVGDVGLSAPAAVEVGGSVIEQVELDQFGRASVDVANALQPGTNEISVEIPEGTYRESASASRTLHLVDGLEVSAEFAQVVERMQRGVAVRGRIADRSGPLEGVRISTRLSREEGESVEEDGGAEEDEPDAMPPDEEEARLERHVRTDEDGNFEAFYGGDIVGDGTWQADTNIVPETGDEISVDTESLTVARGRWNWLFNGLAALAVLGALGLVVHRLWQVIAAYLERRREFLDLEERSARSFSETDEIEPESLDDEHAPIDESPGRMRISGLVWDVWREQPVEGATLTVRSGDGEVVRQETVGAGDLPTGGFVIEDLERGRYLLHIEAYGFMPAELEVRLPHDGSLSNARLDLSAVPLKIRWLYQSVVERLEGEDLWGRLSPRQIEEALVDVAARSERGEAGTTRRAFVEQLELRLEETSEELTVERLAAAMTDLVEETYFSGRNFDREVWRFARDLARRLERQAEEESE